MEVSGGTEGMMANDTFLPSSKQFMVHKITKTNACQFHFCCITGLYVGLRYSRLHSMALFKLQNLET